MKSPNDSGSTNESLNFMTILVETMLTIFVFISTTINSFILILLLGDGLWFFYSPLLGVVFTIIILHRFRELIAQGRKQKNFVLSAMIATGVNSGLFISSYGVMWMVLHRQFDFSVLWLHRLYLVGLITGIISIAVGVLVYSYLDRKP